MGDYSDFYGVRGSNWRTVLKVKYASGRIEKHDYGTFDAACRARKKFEALDTVMNTEILKKKIRKATPANEG